MTSSSESSSESGYKVKNKKGKKPQQKAPSSAAKQDNNKGCSCQATVLVCEDNFYNVVPLKMILRTAYHIEIERAENGKLGAEAYERNLKKTCCREYYKLIFMDINMPVLDGFGSAELIFKTYATLSKQPAYSHIEHPMIFAMTAYKNE